MAEALFDPLVWLILLPILWGVLAFLPGPGRGATLALVGLTLQLGCAVRLTLDIMARGPLTPAAGGMPRASPSRPRRHTVPARRPRSPCRPAAASPRRGDTRSAHDARRPTPDDCDVDVDAQRPRRDTSPTR